MGNRVRILTFLVISFLLPLAHAKEDVWQSRLGKETPYFQATPASGPWAEQHPFNVERFGLTRGVGPLASKRLVVVFTRSLEKPVLELARAIDRLVAQNDDLRGSYIHKFDPKGAQLGGYTAGELAVRVDEMKGVADENELHHLSIGIATNASYDAFGIEHENDVVVVLFDSSKHNRKVLWFKQISSEKTDQSKASEVAKDLKEAIDTLKAN